MKKTLIVLSAAIALVGCDRNRGGMGRDSNRSTGSSRDTTTYPSATRDSSINTPSITATNTNKVITPDVYPNGTTPAPDTTPKN
jgi:hypothetical protein